MWEDVHEAVDKRLLADAIGEILMSLSDRERTVVYLKFWEGLNFVETGKRCNVSPARVSQSFLKAMRKLRGDKSINILAKCAIPEAEKERSIRLKKEIEEERYRKLSKVLKKPETIIYLPHGRCTKRPIEFPEYEDKIVKNVRSSILPPLQVTLVHTPDGIPYLHVPYWIGNIVRAHDPKKYDEWMDWLQKNGNHITKDRRNIWD